MSQNTLIMPTTGTWSGLQIMNQINPALDSLASCFAGNTKPTVGGTGGVFQTGQWWLDTSNPNQNMVCMSLSGVDQRLFPLTDGQFQARAQSTPNMTVTISSGYIFTGTALSFVAAQTTSAFTAPVGNPRIDRIVIDALTGAYSVIAGTPAASPSPPAIPAGKCPVAKISIAVGQASITNGNIFNEFYNNDSIYGGGIIAGALTLQNTLAVTGAITPSQTAGIVGTTTNNNANAGSVGEVISGARASGSALALTSGSAANITTISLSAGDWDVYGNIVYLPAAAAVINLAYHTATPTTLGIDSNNQSFGSWVGTFTGDGSSVVTAKGVTRIQTTTTTTVYLVGVAAFSGTCSAWGTIFARRRR